MLRQVFSSLFQKKQPNNLMPNEQYNGQAQIYSIPTVSSNFASKKLPTSTSNVENNHADLHNRFSNSESIKNLEYYAKYDDNNTRHIYIAPHCIRYSNSTLDDTIYRIDDEYLNEIAAEILESENMPPKLQIVYYDNNYFAINNGNLQIYKQLQLSGLITHVQADLISVEAIPFPLREFLLQTPSRLDDYNGADEDYQTNCDELSFNQSNGMSNQSGANESLNGSEIHHECSYSETAPNVVFVEDVFEDKELYVDEVYEFGEAENCVDSGEEDCIGENVAGNGEKQANMNSIGINYDSKAKLEINLKEEKKISKYSKVDLTDVVKKFLKNEKDEQMVFENLDRESKVCEKLESLRLDLKQKVLNEELFGAQLFPRVDGKLFSKNFVIFYKKNNSIF